MPGFWTRLYDSLPRDSKNLVWRVPLVAFVIVVSLFIFFPFQDTPYAVRTVHDYYRVKGDREELVPGRRKTIAYEVTRRWAWLTSPFHYEIEREVSAKALPPAEGYRVKERRIEVLSSGLNLGLDLRGGTELLYRILQEEGKQAVTADEIKEVIQKRIDAYGLREPRIQAQGVSRILVQLPGQSSAALENLKRIIRNIGHLEFRLVADENSAAYQEWNKSGQAVDPPGYRTYTIGSLGKEGYVERKVLIHDEPQMTGVYIRATRVNPPAGERLSYAVGLSFTPQGEQRFARVTGENVGKQLAIVLNTRRGGDDRIVEPGICYSAPVIRQRILGDAEITGAFSEGEAASLRTVLMAGSLPAPLALEHENTVGPSLGPALIAKGVRAIVIGFALVVLFMAAHYWFAGSIADFALLLNVFIIVSIMILFDATLTLPGIAGLLLTVGMSVDANVLIFERVREELAGAGDKPLRLAIRDGYGRAFWTIFDANLTTLFTALILYWIGTGAVKGFAVVLTIGILTSMFTALVVTRVVFDVLTWRRLLTRLPMAQLFKRTSIGFMRLRTRFFIGSVVLIALGMAVFGARWRTIWDIDFRGGTMLHLVFRQEMDADQITQRLRGEGEAFGRVEVQSIAAAAQEGVGRRATEFVIRFPTLSEAIVRNVETKAASGPGSLSAAIRLHNPMKLPDLEAALKAAEVFSYTVKGKGEPDPDGKFAAFEVTAPHVDGEKLRQDLDKALAPYKPAEEESALTAFEPDEPVINYRTQGEVVIDRAVPKAEVEAELAKGGDYWVVEAEDGVADDKATGFLIRSSLESPETFRTRVQRAFSAQSLTAIVSRIFKAELAPPDVEPLAERDGQATVAINFAQPISVATLQGELAKWDIQGTVKTEGDGATDRIELELPADKVDELATRLRKDTKTFPLSTPIPRVAKVGPAVAYEMLIWALVAIAAASVIIIAYVWLRFERFKYGVAAVAALLHDVLVTAGLLAIFGRAISLPIVAALLTIIGYSINDTIVVFDRIRENLRRERKRDVDASIIDSSVNQVLSRTLLTSITTLMAVLSLFLFAGGVIQDFALALVIGVVVGTYSSVFIASPLLILHQEQIEKRLRRR